MELEERFKERRKRQPKKKTISWVLDKHLALIEEQLDEQYTHEEVIEDIQATYPEIQTNANYFSRALKAARKKAAAKKYGTDIPPAPETVKKPKEPSAASTKRETDPESKCNTPSTQNRDIKKPAKIGKASADAKVDAIMADYDTQKLREAGITEKKNEDSVN